MFSVRFVIVRYHQLVNRPKRSRWLFGVCGSVCSSHACQDRLVNCQCRRFTRSVVWFVRDALVRTQANTSVHGSERAQACLSESSWRERARHAKPACASAWHEYALMSLISLISRWILPQAKPTDGFSYQPTD